MADSGNNRIQKFNSAGVYQSQFGSFSSGDLLSNYDPNGVAVDTAGNIFVTDQTNNRIQKWAIPPPKPKAIIVAGGGNYSTNELIEADGNGIGNQKADTELAANVRFGDETASGADFPLIGSVSVSPQTLSAGTSATISAENVIDSDGIKKVWAAITPPKNTVCYAADIPVTSLPITELRHTGNNRYEVIYSDFSMKGTYKIAVFATDNRNFTSIPDLQKHVVYVTQTQDFSSGEKRRHNWRQSGESDRCDFRIAGIVRAESGSDTV